MVGDSVCFDSLCANRHQNYCYLLLSYDWCFALFAVDTSCPGISFEKVGCYADYHKSNERPLGDYLFNDRDASIQNWSGKMIDWRNWDVYVPQFACRCAAAAKADNATFFGMQFYGNLIYHWPTSADILLPETCPPTYQCQWQ